MVENERMKERKKDEYVIELDVNYFIITQCPGDIGFKRNFII
jgi:seryl-tRNA synthetase